MKRRVTTILVVGLVLFFAGGIWLPAETQAGTLQRLRADFKNFDGSESSSNVLGSDLGGGKPIYAGSILVPTGVNVLYITFVATGDEKDTAVVPTLENNEGALAALWLSCFVDGVACNAGAPNGTGKAGWIALQKRGPDLEDNSLAYTWCTPAPKPGLHTVQIRLASSNKGKVALEAAHIYVDGAFFATQSDGCNGLDQQQPD